MLQFSTKNILKENVVLIQPCCNFVSVQNVYKEVFSFDILSKAKIIITYTYII